MYTIAKLPRPLTKKSATLNFRWIHVYTIAKLPRLLTQKSATFNFRWNACIQFAKLPKPLMKKSATLNFDVLKHVDQRKTTLIQLICIHS